MKTITFDIETVPQDTLSGYNKTMYKNLMRAQIKKRFNDKNYTLTDLKNLRNLVMSVSPFLGKIIVIGIHFDDGNGNIQTEAFYGYNEKEILLKFWKLVGAFNKGVFVSFNGLMFDVPFILKRSLYYNILPTNNNFLNLRRFSTWPHFDVKLIFGDWDKFAVGTLDTITQFLNIPTPKDGKVAAKDVYAAYLNKDIKSVADYCLKDVTATYDVYKKLQKYVFNPFQ